MTLTETMKILNVYTADSGNYKSYLRALLLEMIYSASLRRSELVALELNDYEPIQKALKIRHSKNGHARIVPLGETSVELLETYLQDLRPQSNSNRPLLHQNGKPIHPSYLTRITQRAREKSQIRTQASSHSFRKSSATHMLRNGAPLRAVQALLGHLKIDSTTLYTKVYPQDIIKMHRAHHPREKQKNLKAPELQVPEFFFKGKRPQRLKP